MCARDVNGHWGFRQAYRVKPTVLYGAQQDWACGLRASLALRLNTFHSTLVPAAQLTNDGFKLVQDAREIVVTGFIGFDAFNDLDSE